MDKDKEENKWCSATFTKEMMKWYGWGSPIGLAVFFVGGSLALLLLGGAAALIRYVFLGCS